jgi:exodeoxyribonuclease-3
MPNLVKQGWKDAIRARHPDKPMYTFWDYTRHRWERTAVCASITCS